MEDVPQSPQLTKSGRRKKPDKWANMLKEKLLAHDALIETAAQLEKEQSRLRDKELLLTQVLDTLQALVVDAVKQPAASAGARTTSTTPPAPATWAHHGSSSHQPPAASSGAVVQHGAPTAQAAAPADADDDDSRLLWMMVVDAVQQREAEISRMYGLLADSLGPRHLSSSTQQRMQEMLKALCSPDNVTKVGSMTVQQLTARLSVLAGQIALHLMAANAPHPVPDPATASISGPLQACYMEYSSLLMTAMVWHSGQLRSVVKTNLETQEPFAELPTGEHWLKALQQLQLTEQQLHVLCCVFDRYTAGVTQLTAALERNLQQQAHNVCVANLLKQQQQGHGPGQAGAATTTAGQQQAGVPADPAGAGCPPASGTTPDSSHPPAPATTQTQQQQQQQQQLSSEALLQEQQWLLRQWLLLALHLGIVTACTLSTYQQALFVTGCYPSISRMDFAIAALKEQRRQQQQAVEGSSPQPMPTGSSPGGKEAPGTPGSS